MTADHRPWQKGYHVKTKRKEHVDSVLLETTEPVELLEKLVADDEPALLRRLLSRHPELQARINDPLAAFDSPVITLARSREMLDVLCAAGADLNAKSQWWAGGFALLHHAEPGLAAYAIERGAVVDIHAAARLGKLERLRELISAEPALVRAPGGDGQTPLHFASTVEIATFLLDHGADIDARDVDHESTPAQYMVRDRQEVCRHLVRCGGRTDILMAAALGDADLVQRHLAADPQCVRMRVSDQYFPKRNPRSGGTIYQWTLGWFLSPHEVARRFGHAGIYRLLLAGSPDEIKLLAACEAGDEAAMKSLLAGHPGLAARLAGAEPCSVVYAARNNQSASVRLLLAAGVPAAAQGPDGVTPLHWAAFHGNAEMTGEILRYQPPLEVADTTFKATPLGWAIYGSEHGWHRRTGDYPATMASLLKAGAQPPEKTGGT